MDACVPLQRTTYLYSQQSSQLSFADWEWHSPWLTVDLWTLIISCMVFQVGPVLRRSPSKTKIQTPVCASCAESFGQSCQTWHPRLRMDKSQMENGVLRKCFQAPCFCARDQCQVCWDGLTPSSLGKAQPPGDWCWAIPFVHAQMGSRSLTELRVWRLWANRRPCSNNVLIHRAPHGERGLTVLDDETWRWLNNTTASIWFRQYSSLG